jgi:hypothetical protein
LGRICLDRILVFREGRRVREWEYAAVSVHTLMRE